jgi:hypothetical protein
VFRRERDPASERLSGGVENDAAQDTPIRQGLCPDQVMPTLPGRSKGRNNTRYFLLAKACETRMIRPRAATYFGGSSP